MAESEMKWLVILILGMVLVVGGGSTIDKYLNNCPTEQGNG